MRFFDDANGALQFMSMSSCYGAVVSWDRVVAATPTPAPPAVNGTAGANSTDSAAASASASSKFKLVAVKTTPFFSCL